MLLDPDQQRKRPRKQPSQARSRAAVNAIVEAAARILEDHGHAGFNTNAVAERAGVSIGTLYQYFPDSDAVLGALISREASSFIDAAERAAAALDGTTALFGLIDAAVAHQMGRPRLARLLDFEEGHFPRDRDTQQVRNQFSDIVKRVLRRIPRRFKTDLDIEAVDIAVIVRALIDAAGERDEEDVAGLGSRVQRAVYGYLQASGFEFRDEAAVLQITGVQPP